MIRGTLPDVEGFLGRGIHVQSDHEEQPRSNVEIRRCLIDSNHEFGLLFAAADAIVESTAVRGTRPNVEGFLGRGIHVERHGEGSGRSSVVISESVLEENSEAGLFIAESDAVIVATSIRGVSSAPSNQLGDGVVVYAENAPASAIISAVRVEQSERAAISNFGGTVELQSSLLLCNGLDLSTQRLAMYGGILRDRGGNRCGCPEPSETCEMADEPITAP